MSHAKFEATVKNGQIQLPANVSLPEDTKVYVVVPEIDSEGEPRLRSPRLAHPREIVDFQKRIIAGHSDAGV